MKSQLIYWKARGRLPFGKVRGNVRNSSIARWKARGRLPVCDNCTFFASYYGSDVISRYWLKSGLFRGVGQFKRKFPVKGDYCSPTFVDVRKLESSL